MIVVYLLAKLVQIILLLLCLAILSFGLYQFTMGMWYYTRGQTVEGRVTTVHTAKSRDSTDSRGKRVQGAAFRFPVIEYRFPPDQTNDTYQIQSMVPRHDLNEGDPVTVRVLANEPQAGRAVKSLLGNILIAGCLLFGLVMTSVIVLMWYGLDQMLGRPVHAGGMTMFHGWAGWIFLLATGTPVLLVGGFFYYYLPWMKVSEYPELFDPRRLMLLAEVRGGPPKPGESLNDCEHSLGTLPFRLGMGAVSEGFERAMRDRTNNPARFNRYLAAIADPNTPFPLYLPRLLWLIPAQEPPEVLDQFLATGIELDESEQARLLETAQGLESPRQEQILKILAKHGIPEPPAR